jgi:hypothetical protein
LFLLWINFIDSDADYKLNVAQNENGKISGSVKIFNNDVWLFTQTNTEYGLKGCKSESSKNTGEGRGNGTIQRCGTEHPIPWVLFKKLLGD